MNALSIAKDKFGRLDTAVNCAGIGVAFKTYNFKKDLPHSIEDFIRVLTVSLIYIKKIHRLINRTYILFHYRSTLVAASTLYVWPLD